MFNKILIANRGEIARRIQSTCRRLGVATVAVYSDADAGAGFVHEADEAIHIGAAPATESYLNIARIVRAAVDSGAEAIHPGYGFLAENAQFAKSVIDAGLVFIGPEPDTIALMGSKIASKQRMEKAGVACVPGYHGDKQDDDTLFKKARAIGFPVLVKASAGGGGKGMRVVAKPADFIDACAGARREAASAFGDDRLLLEKFIERPRHIEVQVFGDGDGNVVHMFERECSVQRRYQKIIEEAPSPVVDDDLRQRITAAAVRAAEAVSYRNAGTIEFIVDANGEFFFMEMNTRLQVEHPVTEMITGHDLVEWQLHVAAGDGLPCNQDSIAMNGHAIEVRVYAEDPFQNFLPAAGTIEVFATETARNLRVDADLRAGQTISVFYDPMIAKLSCHEADRAATVTTLTAALDEVAILGPATNLPLLRQLLRHDDFIGADIDTGYVDRHLDDLIAGDSDAPLEALAAAALRDYKEAVDRASPWARDGWQANGQTHRSFAWRFANGQTGQCVVAADDSGISVAGEEESVTARSVQVDGDELFVDIPGRQLHARVRRYGAWRKVRVADGSFEFLAAPVYAVRRDAGADAGHPGAPMPGRIVKVHVAPGDRVSKGQALVVLEGMKMEFTVHAAMTGVVESVLFAEGDQVDAEVPLVDLQAENE